MDILSTLMKQDAPLTTLPENITSSHRLLCSDDEKVTGRERQAAGPHSWTHHGMLKSMALPSSWRKWRTLQHAGMRIREEEREGKEEGQCELYLF